MDMWDPYIHAVKSHAPHVKIVFDLFHVVSSFGKEIRNTEYRKASKENKEVFKGSKYLFLKNKRTLRKKGHREHLKQLLSLNETINTAYILKDKVKLLWHYRSRTWAKKPWMTGVVWREHLLIQKFTNLPTCFRNIAMES